MEEFNIQGKQTSFYKYCPGAFEYILVYCHLWPVWLYHIFSHRLVKYTIFGGKNLLAIKYVFGFSLQFCMKYFSL